MSIPSTWQQETLGALASQITKGTTPTTVGFQYQTDGIPFVKVENIIDGLVSISSVKNFIDEKAHSALKRSQFQAGDVIFSIAGTIGKTALVSESNLPANTNQAIAIIRGISDSFVPRFLNLHLQEAAKRIRINHARGGAMNNISLADLKSITVSLPPLAEQKIIADKLDTLLAQVDNTKARLERIPEILKRFRQSVLAAAVSGRLTGGVAVSEKKIGDLFAVIGGLTKNAKRAELPVKNKYLRVANVYENELRLDDVKEIGIKESELSKAIIKAGDLLIVEGNGSLDQIGRVALWDDEIESCVHQNHLIKIRAKKEEFDPRFVLYFFMSPIGKERIVEKATSGAGLYTLSISKVSAIEMPVFNVEEQTEIVRRVDQLFAYADTIERQVNSALERVNQLTQSILAKAFRGELTAQWREDNPELISGENSAEALLARIKAERAAKAPIKRTRKKATA